MFVVLYLVLFNGVWFGVLWNVDGNFFWWGGDGDVRFVVGVVFISEIILIKEY